MHPNQTPENLTEIKRKYNEYRESLHQTVELFIKHSKRVHVDWKEQIEEAKETKETLTLIDPSLICQKSEF